MVNKYRRVDKTRISGVNIGRRAKRYGSGQGNGRGAQARKDISPFGKQELVFGAETSSFVYG